MQDGAEWLQGVVDVLRPDAVRILVSPHAIEHLTAAAQPVLGTATPELIAWLDQQAHTLKHATDVGFARVRTLSSKFVIPVQIDKFDPERLAKERQAGRSMLVAGTDGTNSIGDGATPTT